MKGKVKWFDSTKGYGFIQTDEGSEIFVHYTGIQKKGYRVLDAGQEVDFEITDGKNGPQATQVVLVGN